MNPTTFSRADLVAQLLAPVTRVGDHEPPYGQRSTRDAAVAHKLGIARELLMRDLQAQMRSGPIMDSPQVLKDWLRLYCAGLEHEVFLVLYLSASHALIYSLGTPDHPQLSPRGMYYAAQYPARAYPCQRFAHTLSNVHA